MQRVILYIASKQIIHIYEVDNVLVGPNNGKYLGALVFNDEWDRAAGVKVVEQMGAIATKGDPRRAS